MPVQSNSSVYHMAAQHNASPPLRHAPLRRLRRWSLLKSTIRRVRGVRSEVIDRALNIRTPYPNSERYDLNTHFGDAVPNEPVDYVLLRKFMRHVRTKPDDVVFDIGCGMGRVLCLFARRHVKRCVGIEYDRKLAECARENAARLRGRMCEIEVRCGDAVDADYSQGTIYWMFNPFGKATLQAVMRRIEQSLADTPRSVQIAYINPVHEDVLRAMPWLEWAGHSRSPFFNTYGASFWRHRVSNAAASALL